MSNHSGPMPDPGSYGSPAAFRRAVTDRLRSKAASSRWELPQLQRQLAYDRLLERLYLLDDGWIVKGATALLARDIGVRATIDVDLYRRTDLVTAEADFRSAAGSDIGDWFRFEVGPAYPVAAGGLRLPVSAFIGTTVFVAFHVDLVAAGICMTGEPEWAPPMARMDMRSVEQHGYRVYPLVDHIADKVVAILERHGGGSRPSTRYKDLVDLVVIVEVAGVDARRQRAALRSEADRRAVRLPAQFDVPDRPAWEAGYGAEARRSLLPDRRTLDQALTFVRAFVDPLLDGTAVGRWVPGSGWLRGAGGG